MKIKKNLKFQNKLTKLQLLETKAFEKKSELKLEDVEYRLKNVSHVIHKYNVMGKSILFVGIPMKIGVEIQRFINNKKHIFLPTSVWIKGILSNKKLDFLNLSKNPLNSKSKLSKIASKIKTKVELIVILKDNVTNDVVEESHFSRKPTILFNKNLGIQDKKSDYKVPGNLGFKNKQSYENLFYSILVATLKKRSKVK